MAWRRAPRARIRYPGEVLCRDSAEVVEEAAKLARKYKASAEIG
jgi:hypothetical protein